MDKQKYIIGEALKILQNIIPPDQHNLRQRVGILRFANGIPCTTTPIYRDCLYHITPMGNYRWNIEQLKKYEHVFNGNKLAAVAQGPGLESIDIVRKLLPDFAMFDVSNDTNLRETVSFKELLVRGKYSDSKRATFYAHTKGVTRGDDEAVRLWTEALYFHNLGRYEECVTLLEKHPCVGAFKSYQKHTHFPAKLTWHYSGTFFWFRNDAFFSKPYFPGERAWDDVIQNRYGVEAHLGMLFSKEEAGCIFGDNVKSLYSLPYTRKLVNSYKEKHDGGRVGQDNDISGRSTKMAMAPAGLKRPHSGSIK